MKNISKWMVLPALLTMFWSCKKDENKDYYMGGTSPLLSASDTSLKLLPANAAQNSITLNWTNPNYQFTTGVSSQNVNYALQIDTLGSNFTNPKMFSLTIANDLSKTFIVDEINSDLSNAMGLATGTQHTVQMRVSSSLGTNGAALLTSNVLQFKTTPYSPPPAIAPPTSNTLFIVGDATPGGSAHGWDNPISNSPLASQQFTKVGNAEYKITIALIGGKEFKFIAVNGSWTDQWSVKTQDTYQTGGPFVYNGANCQAPAASGNYIVDVNFQTGFFTVTPQ